ncbi:MAG: hypothetical protein Q4C02_10710 [Eubacteriales bacterium]|nr:hypothetical protein [Eubacteriales bacterium]
MDRFFKLKENGTDVRTEVLAGITTFMTMAYILAVNPGILADGGMDKGAVFTAPALIIVGFMMMQEVTKIDWEDPLESIPAYISIFAMPFMYSIAEGIAFGVISYVLLHLFARRTKDLSPAMYILAVLFVAKYVML